jgi:hypothetical protein
MIAIIFAPRSVEVALAGMFLLLLLAGIRRYRSARDKRQAAKPDITPEIIDALSVFLGGNRDSSRLRALVAAHTEEVQDTILRYQTIVAGRREEICELAIQLGYVQRWCHKMHSTKIVERRKAFACVSAVAHYEPVRRLIGNIPSSAFQDPDEQIRLEAARILLSTGEPAELLRVFQGALVDTQEFRQMIARDLGRYAIPLCETAVPQALRSPNPRNVLKLLVSWERALPLPNAQLLAEHPDPAVRAEVMRLLPFLPSTAENRAAMQLGLDDPDHGVKTAAAAAASRLKPQGPYSMVSYVPYSSPEFAHAGEVN